MFEINNFLEITLKLSWLINTFLDKIISEFNNQTIFSILINYYYYHYHQFNSQIYRNFYNLNVPDHPSFSTKGKSNANNFY